MLVIMKKGSEALGIMKREPAVHVLLAFINSIRQSPSDLAPAEFPLEFPPLSSIPFEMPITKLFISQLHKSQTKRYHRKYSLQRRYDRQ